jgi:hypothetical protein
MLSTLNIKIQLIQIKFVSPRRIIMVEMLLSRQPEVILKRRLANKKETISPRKMKSPNH